MYFDAGKWGKIEVATIEYKKDCIIGIKDAGSPTSRVFYSNYGKEGCSCVKGVLCKP